MSYKIGVVYYRDFLPANIIEQLDNPKLFKFFRYEEVKDKLKRYKIEEYLKRGFCLVHLIKGKEFLRAGYIGELNVHSLLYIKEMFKFREVFVRGVKYRRIKEDVFNIYLYVNTEKKASWYYFRVLYGKFLEILQYTEDVDGVNKRFLIVENTGNPYLIYENLSKKVVKKMELYLFNPKIVSSSFESVILSL